MTISRERFDQVTLSQYFDALVQQEERIACDPKGPESTGTKYLPEITSGGLTWYQFARQVYRQKGIVNILDLGAGSDAGAWTGGQDGTNLNDQVKQLRANGISLTVTAQSAIGEKEWCETHGITRFVKGHFLNALKRLKTEGVKFDIVLSRFSLYGTVGVYSILDHIDRVLAENGRAFLEEVYIGPGSTLALVFLPGLAPKSGSLDNFHFTTPGFILSPYQSQAGGLPYKRDINGWHTGFKKGDLDRTRLPKFVGIAKPICGIMSDHWHALFEAQYPRTAIT